jgi:hypothetical protein
VLQQPLRCLLPHGVGLSPLMLASVQHRSERLLTGKNI